MQIFDNAGGGTNADGSYSFTIPAGVTYMKYYVTGSGANGGVNSGGAAATVIGNVSAAPDTEFTIHVGAAPTPDQGGDGKGSCIMVGANCIAISYGGNYSNVTAGLDRGVEGTGLLGTSEPQFLNGHIFVGGRGGVDTDTSSTLKGLEESEGAASYWGAAPAPGAGSGGHYGSPIGNAGDGFVMFEWN
jgi:hypothetical protein